MIYREKMKSLGSRIHDIENNSKDGLSMNDFFELFDSYIRYFEIAVNHNEIYPNWTLAEQSRESIDMSRGLISGLFSGKGIDDEINSYLKNKVLEFDILLERFENRYNNVSNHIELYFTPDKTAGDVIFDRGKIILETNHIKESKGFYVFSFSFENYLGKKNLKLFGPLNDYGIKSIDDAVDIHTNLNVLETVVFVDNTKGYPLNGAVLPIVIRKLLDKKLEFDV